MPFIRDLTPDPEWRPLQCRVEQLAQKDAP
jgi:hypothetical protein